MNDHHRGLAFDLATLLDRRRALGLLGGTALAALTGCGGDDEPQTAATASEPPPGTPSPGGPTATATPQTTTTSQVDGDCTQQTPQETGGPYPADGTNGPNVLTRSGIVRSDIRSSFGGASGTAAGIPLTVQLTLVNAGDDCAAYKDAAVYLWHCDQQGRYSMYSEGVTNENYLRGVQAANAKGVLAFKTVFPAAYSGRWPHLHFEVYPTIAKIASAADRVLTSQIALPEAVCKTVYAASGYEQSAKNLPQTPLVNDNVFSDGYGTQMATVTGSAASGYLARLTVTV